MRGFMRFALLPALALSCFAAPISTGTANWQVSQTSGVLNSGNALNVQTTAVALTGSLPSVWVAAPSGSAWVGQLATDGNEASGLCNSASGATSCGAQPGNYSYVLSFGNGFGGILSSFQYTADNSVTITISDTSGVLWTNTSGANSHSALLTGPTNLSYVGNLTITALVTNSALQAPYATLRNPSGFLAVGDAVANSEGIPEPSTYAMLGLGSAALLFARLRRK